MSFDRDAHMEARPAEVESRKIAGHLVYIYTATGRKSQISLALRKAKNDYYGKEASLDTWKKTLIWEIGQLSEEQKDKILYDGRNADARGLADWWENHLAQLKKDEEQKRREEDQEYRDVEFTVRQYLKNGTYASRLRQRLLELLESETPGQGRQTRLDALKENTQ